MAYDFTLPASCPNCRRTCVWNGHAWVCEACNAVHTGNLLPTLGLDECVGCERTVDLARDEDLPTCIHCLRRLCRGCWLDCNVCGMPCCPRCGITGRSDQAWRSHRTCRSCKED